MSCRLPVIVDLVSGLAIRRHSALHNLVHAKTQSARRGALYRVSCQSIHDVETAKRENRAVHGCLTCEMRKVRRSMLLKCRRTRIRVSVGRSSKEPILR